MATDYWLPVQRQLWLLPGALPAPYKKARTVVVNIRYEHTCCLECRQSDDPQTCSKKGAIKPSTTVHIVINDGHHVSRTVWASHAQSATTSLRIVGGRSPWRVYNTATLQNPVTYIVNRNYSHTTKSSDVPVCSQQELPHQQSRKKYEDKLLSWWCARRSRVSVCRPAAAVHGNPAP